MKKFAPLLKSINDRLDLPQPEKSRILIEIASDMEDLYHFLKKKGNSESEIMKIVDEKFNFSDEEIADLIDVHESFFKKLMYKFSEQAQTTWERALLIAILLFVAAASGKVISSTDFFYNASMFIWPVTGIGILAIALSFRKFYLFYIKKDHNIRKLHSGLPAIFVLACSSLFIGITGYYLELYMAGDYALAMDAKFVGMIIFDIDSPILKALNLWLIKTSSMIMASLIVSISTALSWFILFNKAQKIGRAELAFILEK